MRSALLFLLIALQVLDYSSYAAGYLDVNEYCQTSYGTIGVCLPVEYCPGASDCDMEICSYVGGNLIICCEHLEHVEEDEGEASIKSGAGKNNANQNNAESCGTEAGRSGTCLSIKQCPGAQLTNRKSLTVCRMEGSELIVCCEESAQIQSGIQELKTNGGNAGHCQTDYGEQGVCVSINQCHSAQQPLTRGVFPNICQHNDATPTVCCAHSDDDSTDLKTLGASDNAESCRTASGRSGTCLNMKQCPGAQLTRVNNLTVCRMEGSEPIVCCEQSAQIQTTFPELKTNGRALRKCLEYEYRDDPIPADGSRREIYGLIGGENANLFEFPHMAVLGYGNDNDIRWACGGSLISEKFVITAAHCIRTLYGRVQIIALGAYQISAIKENSVQLFKVKNPIPHPNYRFPLLYNDIALIELDREVKFERGVYPACLNTEREIQTKKHPFKATGWGATELYGPPSDILQKIELELVPFNNCSKYYRQSKKLPNGLDDDSQICAHGPSKRVDTCQGDSGGPLQLTIGIGVPTIVGITSFGDKCALVPGTYTRVFNYIPWIESIVWPN